jgi:rhodanese-related sulfurtransferase
MRILFKLLAILIVSGSLFACSEDIETREHSVQESESTSTETNSAEVPSIDEPKFEPNYISAKELKVMFEEQIVPFIFDVRAILSFEQSHIETALSMPYGKTDDERLSSVSGLNKSSSIVTYCGCPRHLSSLSAEDLTNRGYSNVKVLYEGYWHWKDSSYPIIEAPATAEIETLRFEGVLTYSDTPAEGIDMFLKHQESGQLEAARTRKDGSFEFDFHLYNFNPTDKFEVIVANISNHPVQQLNGLSETINQLNIQL